MFEDIKIIGIDEDKTKKIEDSAIMYGVYLSLSASPPNWWREIFNKEHKSRQSKNWREASVGAWHIFICCPLSEVQMHLDDHKLNVKNTNEQYRQYEAAEQQRQAKQSQEEQEERNQLSAIAKKLKFD